MSDRLQFDFAAAGSALPSQYQIRLRGGGSRFSVANLTPSTAMRFRPIRVTPANWTAVTTGYPGAPHSGTPTYYRATLAHNFGIPNAVVIDLQDEVGRTVKMQIVEVTNEDQTTPGTINYNETTIWISSDAAPATDMYVVMVG